MNEILSFVCGAVVSTGSVFLFMMLQKKSIKEANEFNLKSQLAISESNTIAQKIINETSLPFAKERTAQEKILAEREFVQISFQEKRMKDEDGEL